MYNVDIKVKILIPNNMLVFFAIEIQFHFRFLQFHFRFLYFFQTGLGASVDDRPGACGNDARVFGTFTKTFTKRHDDVIRTCCCCRCNVVTSQYCCYIMTSSFYLP